MHGDNEKKKTKLLDSDGAFVTFFKSLFGAGLLSLPNAIGRVGLLLGVAVYSLVGIGCAFSCYLLLQAKRRAMALDDAVEEGHYRHRHRQKLPPANDRSRRGNRQQHLVTYGDLADLLLGPTMASITRWTVIALNILFTAGLAIVICENMGEVLRICFHGGADASAAGPNQRYEQEYYRTIVGLFLLPIVIGLLQIPWLQDMWFISAMGLAVYTVGVIGSALFSAVSTILMHPSFVEDGDTSANFITGRGIPNNLWSVDWNGIPSFVGTAVYALEGINLALPTAHSMRTESDATRVVCAGVLWYGFITMVFAVVGYAGGLGGGPGTGLTPAQCDVVTSCIAPPILQYTIQITLSIAMTLSIPVMLYPSTEMLEVMLADMRYGNSKGKHQREKCLRIPEEEVLSSSVESEPIAVSCKEKDGYEYFPTASPKNVETYGSMMTTTSLSPATNTAAIACETPDLEGEEGDGRDEKEEELPSFSQEKSWKLRVFLAVLTVTMGTVTKSFTFYSELIGAVGLSFAGFVLPPLLYLRSMERARIPISRPMKAAMSALAIFGFYNMLAGGMSSLRDLWHSYSSYTGATIICPYLVCQQQDLPLK